MIFYVGNCVECYKGKKIISATKNSSLVNAVVVGSNPTLSMIMGG
jgi:hypothetical protein